jgi:hypothetical protein
MERLETCAVVADKESSSSQPVLGDNEARWKEQTLRQVAALYRHCEIPPADVLACIETTVASWKASPSQPKPATSTAPTSFSLLSMMGGAGGLAAFFSWPAVLQDAASDAEVWLALVNRVEYLEDVLADGLWTTEIRPWIRERLWNVDAQTSATTLYRKWYGKARRPDAASPETNAMALDMMVDLFQALDEDLETMRQGTTDNEQSTAVVHESTTTTTSTITSGSSSWSKQRDDQRRAFLSLAWDMVTDYMVRTAACPPHECLEFLWKASFSTSTGDNDSDAAAVLSDTLVEKDPLGHWLQLYLQTHPSLYRQMAGVSLPFDFSLLAQFLNASDDDDSSTKRKMYALALLARVLAIARPVNVPWRQWCSNGGDTPAAAQQLVYQQLSDAVRRPGGNHAVYQEGLAAIRLAVPTVD